MSSPVSISDICLLIKALTDLWNTVKGVSKDLDEAVQEMEKMATLLSLLETRIGNQELLKATNPNLWELTEQVLDSLRPLVDKTQATLEEYACKPQLNFSDMIGYVMGDKTRLRGLQEGFRRQEQRLNLILTDTGLRSVQKEVRHGIAQSQEESRERDEQNRQETLQGQSEIFQEIRAFRSAQETMQRNLLEIQRYFCQPQVTTPPSLLAQPGFQGQSAKLGQPLLPGSPNFSRGVAAPPPSQPEFSVASGEIQPPMRRTEFQPHLHRSPFPSIADQAQVAQ